MHCEDLVQEVGMMGCWELRCGLNAVSQGWILDSADVRLRSDRGTYHYPVPCCNCIYYPPRYQHLLACLGRSNSCSLRLSRRGSNNEE